MSSIVKRSIDADTARAMETGDADLAIGLVPGLDSGFYQQTLFTQDWICLASQKPSRLERAAAPARRWHFWKT